MPLLRLRVQAMRWEAEGIVSLELAPLDPSVSLPPWQAGAHVDLHLGNSMVRSYSLLGTAGSAWRVAVNRDEASRGGSRWVHEQLRVGMLLEVGAPRNLFALDEGVHPSLFIAGGIGITPLLAMARRLAELRRPWVMHYAVRSRARAAFVAELQALAENGSGSLHLHVDEEQGRVLDVAAVVAAAPRNAHLYACGPKPLLAAYQQATAGWPAAQVHSESFTGVEATGAASGFTVQLRRSGLTVAVAPGQTVLQAVRAAGVDPMYSCESGVCGTCEVAVLAGTPEHRCMVLSPEERAAGQRMMICCSGSLTPTLELDL